MIKRLYWLLKLAFKILTALFAITAASLSLGQVAQAATPQTAPTIVRAASISSTADAIAAGAYAQLGVPQDCTALVTKALANAGISFHDWPAGYTSLGYSVSSSQAIPGDLLYYNDGGNGLDHVAVYIGNGQAIHGGFNGTTVVFSVHTNSGYPSEYIRVTRGAYQAPAPAPKPAPAPAPQPAPAPAPAPQMMTVANVESVGTHVVSPGETLSTIASAQGLDWHSLWSANPQITNPNAVYVGQQLAVPASANAPVQGQIHIVAAGESLSSIAAAAGLSDWHSLWSANSGISDPNVISVGQHLVMPVMEHP